MPDHAIEGSTLKLALGEYDIGWQDPEASLSHAERLVGDAAARGARLVVLPETCATGYTMDSERWAEPVDGASARRLAVIARDAGVWIVAGLATCDNDVGDACTPRNTAIVLTPDGDTAAIYHKQRLLSYAGEHEAYVPGDSPALVTVDGVRLGIFICYDVRFPELFRPIADQVDGIVIIANWPASRRPHWDVLVPARAIENQCYVIAVNRTGRGGGIDYDGGSMAYGPWGERLASFGGAGPTIVELRAAEVRRVRERYPFLADATRVSRDRSPRPPASRSSARPPAGAPRGTSPAARDR
jgi:predicted amidohydrolase